MAGIRITVAVAGVAQVGREIKQITDGVTDGGGKAVEGACQRITARAKQYVPVRTGELRDSIDYAMRGPTLGVVGVGPPGDAYWFYIEYGTVKFPAWPFFRPAAEPEAARFNIEMVRVVERAVAGVESDQSDSAGEGGAEEGPAEELPIPE
jgi:HK97 gp10 family phage protein